MFKFTYNKISIINKNFNPINSNSTSPQPLINSTPIVSKDTPTSVAAPGVNLPELQLLKLLKKRLVPMLKAQTMLRPPPSYTPTS